MRQKGREMRSFQKVEEEPAMSEQREREREMALHMSKTDEKENEWSRERSTAMDYHRRALAIRSLYGTPWQLGKQIKLI